MTIADTTGKAAPDDRHASAVRRDQLAARAGMIAGPFFLTVVVLLTWWQYHYLRSLGWTVTEDNNVPWPSGLALADHGWLQMLNFAVTGALLLVFVRALPHQLPRRRSARVAAIFMATTAVAMIALAAPTDRDFTAEPSTWHGWTHGMSFLVLVSCSVLTPLITARALRGDARWRPLAPTSVAVAVICGVSLFVPTQLGFYAFLVTIFAWFTAIAARFARITNADTDPLKESTW